MHSTIKRKLTNLRVSVPADYIDVFSAARSAPSRYDVESLDHRCFKDYSKLGYYRSIRPGTVAGDPHVTDAVALCYRPI